MQTKVNADTCGCKCEQAFIVNACLCALSLLCKLVFYKYVRSVTKECLLYKHSVGGAIASHQHLNDLLCKHYMNQGKVAYN